MKKSFIVFVSVFSFLSVLSQSDSLYPLGSNARLAKASAEVRTHAQKKMTAPVPLSLPFFDDFARNDIFPDAAKWADSNVFVNRTYPKAPITLGVATFDGLNKHGYPYNPSAAVNSSAGADTLTSQPIDLSLTNTNVYLSFYYQTRGRGDGPETNDSLVVEFYQSVPNKWDNVWAKAGFNAGPNDSSWRFVIIPVANPAYFNTDFKFRIRNRATVCGALDHWHVDYVYLSDNRTTADSLFADQAFGEQLPSIFRSYSSMPWWQFAGGSDVAATHPVLIRNNDYSSSATQFAVNLTVLDPVGNTVQTPIPDFQNVDNWLVGGWDDFATHSNQALSFSPPAVSDTATIITGMRIIPNDFNLDENTNDTITGYHHLYNYYAFDDGTAEGGVGLNTYGALMAVQIKLNVADTIRAMDIYFDPVVNVLSIPNLTYQLRVWNDNNGVPGTLLYSDTVDRYPGYFIDKTVNSFTRDTFAKSVALTAGGTYYVGIQQTVNSPLNIGFDMNYDHQSQMFYNTSGNWANSSFKGSYMMRPVMRSLDFFSGVPALEKPELHVAVFPNPARTHVTISHSAVKSGEQVLAELYDLSGRLVLSEMITINQNMDVSQVNEGLYILKVSSKNKLLHTSKLFIAR